MLKRTRRCPDRQLRRKRSLTNYRFTPQTQARTAVGVTKLVLLLLGLLTFKSRKSCGFRYLLRLGLKLNNQHNAGTYAGSNVLIKNAEND